MKVALSLSPGSLGAGANAVDAPKARFSLGKSGEPILLLLIVGGLLATSTIFAKAAPDFGWAPLGLLQWSLLGAVILQGLFLVRSSKPVTGRVSDRGARRAGRWEILVYMAITGLLFAVPHALAFAAAIHVGAGFVALCFAFPLVLTYGLSVAFGLDRLHPLRLLGVAFGLLGTVLLAAGARDISPTAFLWTLAALVIPVVISFANIYRTVKWPAGAKPAVLSAGMMATAFAALVSFNASTGIPMLPATDMSAAWTMVAAQSAIFSVQYALYFRLQKIAGPVYLSQIGSVAAMVGLVLAYLAFAEIPTTAQILAAAAAGLGIVFVSTVRRAD